MVSPTTDRRQGLVGNTPFKAPVTTVADGNITQSGQQSVDGVAVQAINSRGVPDRVLCTGMTDSTKNGIWDVSTAAWTRSADCNGNYDLVQGSSVYVQQGTVYGGTYWKLSTAGIVNIGSTAMAWARALTSDTNFLQFLQAGTGAVARGAQDKMRDWVSVKDFGAIGDGLSHLLSARFGTLALAQAQYPSALALTDEIDWCAFAAALAASNSVFVPPGNFRVNRPIPLGSKRLIGFSRGASVITNTVSNIATILLSVGALDFELSNLTLTRSVAAALGGHGIDASQTCDQGRFANLHVLNNFDGVTLGGTGYSYFENSIIESNVNDGVHYTNVNSAQALQWYTSNVLCGANGRNGFFMESVAGKGSCSVASLVRCATFANSGIGFLALGTPSSSLASIRIHQCFFGNDGTGEISLDTYGSTHKITDTFLELAGSSATGIGLATPATNTGSNLVISANNTFTQVSGCDMVQASWHGVDNVGTDSSFVNCRMLANGLAGTVGKRNGLNNSAATGTTMLVGCTLGNNATAQQVNGINTTVDNLLVQGCNLSNNATAALATSVTLIASVVIGNVPATVASVHPNGISGFTSGGMVVGAATGGNLGAGTVNVHTSVSKDNAVYTNP
jgi:hypothetical protein